MSESQVKVWSNIWTEGIRRWSARPRLMYSAYHSTPRLAKGFPEGALDGQPAGSGCTRRGPIVSVLLVVVLAMFQIAVIVSPMAMSMNLIAVIGVITVLTIDFSRPCSELVPTSRRAAQLDLGYRFLLCLLVPPQRKVSKEVCNLWPRRKSDLACLGHS
jgi:hypothetical protein